MKKIFLPSIFLLLVLFKGASAQLQPIDYQFTFYSHGAVSHWLANSKEAYRGKIKDTSWAHFQSDSLALHIPLNGKFDSVKFSITKAYDRAAHITSFDLIIERKGSQPIIFSVNGNFSGEQTSQIKNLKKGDMIMFRNIKCREDKEGSTRSLSPLVVSIE